MNMAVTVSTTLLCSDKVKSKSKNLEFLTTKVIVRIFSISLKIRVGDSWGGGRVGVSGVGWGGLVRSLKDLSPSE